MGRRLGAVGKSSSGVLNTTGVSRRILEGVISIAPEPILTTDGCANGRRREAHSVAELLDELRTTCDMCGRLHIDCDTCPCVLRLGYWVIDGCEHCASRDDAAGTDGATGAR